MRLLSSRRSCKRVADTGVLLLEFALDESISDRTIQAIGRTNFLHVGYQKAGKIMNDDVLCSLAYSLWSRRDD